MYSLVKNAVALALMSGSLAIASPANLITVNQTDYESNAYVNGHPGPKPTPAHQRSEVPWAVVRLACYGQTTPDNKCSAVIKMKTNTAHPVELGKVQLDLNTGEITPATLRSNGFTMTVDGPARATLTQDN